MQPPYEPTSTSCANLLEVIYFEIRDKNVKMYQA